MKTKHTAKMKLRIEATQHLIDICSAAHEAEDDVSYLTRRLLPVFRRAYTTLDKMEKAGLVEFEEKGVYAKILKEDRRS